MGSPAPYQELVPMGAPEEVSRGVSCPVPTMRSIIIMVIGVSWVSCPIQRVGVSGYTRRGV